MVLYAVTRRGQRSTRARSERWFLPRSEAWSDEALLADIDATALLLEDAAQRNLKHWPVLGESVWANDFSAEDRSTCAGEANSLQGWRVVQAAWIGQQQVP